MNSIFTMTEEGMKFTFYLFGVKILEIEAEPELEARRIRKVYEKHQ